MAAVAAVAALATRSRHAGQGQQWLEQWWEQQQRADTLPLPGKVSWMLVLPALPALPMLLVLPVLLVILVLQVLLVLPA